MPSVNKRGDTYRIMVSQGYDIYGKQIRKTTSYTPPEGVTEGKAENWLWLMPTSLRNGARAW